jgi:hypothetical protein
MLEKTELLPVNLLAVQILAGSLAFSAMPHRNGQDRDYSFLFSICGMGGLY